MENLTTHIESIAGFMLVAAKTAPKAKGVENLIYKLLKQNDLSNFADKMREIGKDTERPETFERDAENIRNSDAMIILATRSSSLGLNCRFCGFENCNEANKAGVLCAYNSGDLGIAIGSAVEIANRFHVDNRILYTAGFTAIQSKLIEDNPVMALGIPLSAQAKNIFFDRKRKRG